MSTKTKPANIAGDVGSTGTTGSTGPTGGKDPEEKGKATDPMEELVPFTAPIDPTGHRREIILGVNGETIRVKRGITVEIKRKFVEVWNNSEEQRMAAYETIERTAKGGQAPILEM